MTADLWRLSAASLGRLLERREVSAVELTLAAQARIAKLDPQLNAVVIHNPGARAEAEASDRRRAAGAALGPLDGVPVTIKDNLHARGMRASWGSRLYESLVPQEDELPVARLRHAGAVVLGKTNVPEFCLEGYTGNALFGTTRNPWDVRLTPGGSSGGAVASVASGMVPLAIGTDGGGSIRRPAAYAGLAGFKPSTGRIARQGGFPQLLHDFEVVGPLARTVEDIGLALAIMEGADRRDRKSLVVPQEPAEARRRLRILFVPRFGDAPVDPVIRDSVAEAVGALADLGHAVEEGPLPFDVEPVNARWPLVSQVGLARLLHQEKRPSGGVAAKYRQMAESGAAVPATDYLDMIETVEAFRAQVAQAFERWDVIVTPTCAAMPWPAGEAFPPEIDGQPVGPRGHAVFSGWVNACGHPAVSLPCRPAPSGLPVGLHLVGPFAADRLVLRLAAAYEQARPWADRWPPLAEAG